MDSTIQSAVGFAADCFINGATRPEIKRQIAEKYPELQNTDDVMLSAEKVIAERARFDAEVERGKAIARLEMIFAKAFSAKNFALCRQTVNDLIAMLSLKSKGGRDSELSAFAALIRSL